MLLATPSHKNLLATDNMVAMSNMLKAVAPYSSMEYVRINGIYIYIYIHIATLKKETKFRPLLWSLPTANCQAARTPFCLTDNHGSERLDLWSELCLFFEWYC